ncbi:alpha/beta fold hydrolase [Nonomuraea jiangxiensis]|uniref:Pimeloyl-ACP methyl ester carboxylesterase n=1 Tax=Nonomuraea jiangxiensis TaxID=633440 RepID=A0A1G8UQ00_9ACTN|nr:alpha/beta fold hydrolase [Nonomuraea jiangxiensis]SDJ55577.1 Pimeloyl-ACP methyl ester carboxylesterase [Nonomuraea jiangxiensis]
MILQTLLASALTLGTLTPAQAPAAGQAPVQAPFPAKASRPTVTWQPCPAYSDDVLRSRGLRSEDFAAFRALLGRTECGTLDVPQNYRDPRGKQITIALTRLKATGSRLGSLAVNPGGPGSSGYLMPIDLVMSGVALNERHDLIGFDPRGVGYSTKAACPGGVGPRPPSGPVTEERARLIHADVVRANRACGNSDPAFLGQLTTANVARDLDRIRSALGEPRIGFLGVSWGTWLGVVYRSLFPGGVRRMWLDSVAPPVPRMDVFTEVRATATARDFERMAAWIAAGNRTYGLGATKEEVVATLTRMREEFEARPLTFTDIGLTVDGMLIAQAASQPSAAWPEVAQVLKELKELGDAPGPTAPPTVRRIFGEAPPPPPADAPERNNPTANLAFFCNEDSGPRTFESAWNAYRERLERHPVTGAATPPIPLCAGWPLPVRTTRLRHGGGSLVLSGHLHESPSPYEWTVETRAAVGGHVVTIDDDMHGSALRVPDCAAKVVDYFETGRLTGTCPGVPVPPDGR